MKHLIQTKPQCLLYSFAMALDSTPEKLAKEIGHNGLEILWADLERPDYFKGHHPVEFFIPALRRGYAVMMFPINVVGGPDEKHQHIFLTRQYMQEYAKDLINQNRGVIVTDTHAMAFEKGMIYDPNRARYLLSQMSILRIQFVFTLHKIKSD